MCTTHTYWLPFPLLRVGEKRNICTYQLVSCFAFVVLQSSEIVLTVFTNSRENSWHFSPGRKLYIKMFAEISYVLELSPFVMQFCGHISCPIIAVPFWICASNLSFLLKKKTYCCENTFQNVNWVKLMQWCLSETVYLRRAKWPILLVYFSVFTVKPNDALNINVNNFTAPNFSRNYTGRSSGNWDKVQWGR